jgi:hypothetical protein
VVDHHRLETALKTTETQDKDSPDKDLEATVTTETADTELGSLPINTVLSEA